MKKTLIIISALVLFSCKKESQENFGKQETTPVATEEGMPATDKQSEALGKEIFEGKGACVACHKVDTKLVGPSLQDIAKTYKEKNGNLIAFLKEEAQPIMDPSQYEVMKANLGITKAMTEEELKALEAYINSNTK